jgi:hypothetical protein
MPVFAQKFTAAQDATSDTQARPVAPSAMSPVEQWGDDPFDFIVPSRRRTSERESPSENTGPRFDDDTFARTSHDQSIRPSVIEAVGTVIRRPPPPSPRDRFIVLQRWEGTVVSQDDAGFTAVLRDLTDPRLPEEEVTLPFAEVADGDLELACAGAIFYWAIGYRVRLSGSRERVASLRFRRLPDFSQRDMARIRDDAARLKRLFD